MTDSTNDIPEDDEGVIHQPITQVKDAPAESPVSTPVNTTGDDDDIINQVEPVTAPVEEPEDEDSVVSDNTPSGDVNAPTDEMRYPEDKIDFRGESLVSLAALLQADEMALSASLLDTRAKEVGSWENIILRAITEPTDEDQRIQEALSKLSPEERLNLTARYRDPETNKTLLRISSIISRGPGPGETKTLSGDEAFLAFENIDTGKGGGGYRIPLYNSGITIDVIVPTGNDMQTMLTNCLAVDRELGTKLGAHYFAHGDIIYKTQLLNFIQPLIVNSSYVDWRKKGKLWSVIKFPDIQGLVMTLAAICYKDGFDGFVTKCTRPESETHPDLCRHTETVTANLLEMIVTRFAAMSKESIDFMVEARMGNKRSTLAPIAKYQAGLGLEGERLTFGNLTLTMKIPTVAEYMESGSQFIADIINEIEGDNTDAQYEQIGFRYIRSFVPWIGNIEKVTAQGGTVKTDNSKSIIRELEKFDDKDSENTLRDALRGYINKVQLTYVGYPVTECPSCKYMADTPSGMWTFDPFSAFFTLAFLYLKPE